MSAAPGNEGGVVSGPTVCGESAADRLMRSQSVSRSDVTPAQVAAVLHGLADHTALMAALAYSPPEDGYWPEATSLGRWLHDTAYQLEDR